MDKEVAKALEIDDFLEQVRQGDKFNQIVLVKRRDGQFPLLSEFLEYLQNERKFHEVYQEVIPYARPFEVDGMPLHRIMVIRSDKSLFEHVPEHLWDTPVDTVIGYDYEY